MSYAGNNLKASNIKMLNPYGFAVRLTGDLSNTTDLTSLTISADPNVPNHVKNENTAGVLIDAGTVLIKDICFDGLHSYGLKVTNNAPVNLTVDGVYTTAKKFSKDVDFYFDIANTNSLSSIKISNIKFPLEKDIFDASTNRHCVARIKYNANELKLVKQKSDATAYYSRFVASVGESYMVNASIYGQKSTFIVSLTANISGGVDLHVKELYSSVPSPFTFVLSSHEGTSTSVPDRIECEHISIGWSSEFGYEPHITITSV
jgi:hypothetical protein